MMFYLVRLTTLVILILLILLSGLGVVASDSKVSFSVKPEASPVLPTMVCFQCFIYGFELI